MACDRPFNILMQLILNYLLETAIAIVGMFVFERRFYVSKMQDFSVDPLRVKMPFISI